MRRESRREQSPDGDKPVDSVDNLLSHQHDPAPKVTGDEQSANLRGPDLAKAALETAKQAAKARGAAPARRRASGRQGARRRAGWSGARADDRDPQQLGRLASRIAADRGWADSLSDGAVFGRWGELVGTDVAEHAQPVSLRDGELTVQATSTAWATQLRLLQRELLGKIAAGVGRGVVKKLRIHGPAAPSWRHGHRHVPGRGPRDTYG